MKENKEWSKVKNIINKQLSDFRNKGDEFINLGPYYQNMICNDLKHISFSLSRYKFASKLMMYREKIKVLELGCNEAIGSLIFRQNNDVEYYVGIDFDNEAIEWNRANLPEEYIFIEDDFLNCSKIGNEKFDVVLSIDVIEHIEKENENDFCRVISEHVEDVGGVAVIGTPTVYMSPYACEASRIGHVNLYDQKRLYELMNKYFNNVFIFNMNDEVVHTGFAPMSCYIFAVCTGKKI